jgi:hypothetical protein
MVSDTLLSLLARTWEPPQPRSLNLERKRLERAQAASTEQATSEAKETAPFRVEGIKDEAAKQKDLSDKRKLASMLQNVGDYKSYNDATSAFFNNTYPNLDPQERKDKLLSWGLEPIYSSRTKQNIQAIEDEVVNDVDQRKAKDLLDYEYGLKNMLEALKLKFDPDIYKSNRAKLANDYQVAMARGDTAVAAVTQQYLKALDQEERANARKAEQNELASSMKDAFPDLGAVDSSGNPEYDVDQSSYLVTQKDFEQAIKRYKDFDKAKQYIQRKWILDSTGIFGGGRVFRPRTEEELNDYDISEALAAPDNIQDVSELYQYLNSINFK